MLNDRRRLVLKALVEEHIDSGQPVGSKCIVDRYHLGCSPATVRSELSALEETGYVYQPHVSSGRVPTDTGYRAFVDDLIESDSIATLDEAVEIRHRYLSLASEIDALMRQTSSLLSHLTHYVAVVLAPTLDLSRVRKVDLVSMTSRRALLVVITQSGQVVNRTVDLAEETSPERLADVERALNARLDGKRAADVRPLRQAVDVRRPDEPILGEAMEQVVACLEEADRDRLYHVGVPELLRLPEFANAGMAAPLMTVLEDGLALLDAFKEVVRTGGLTVRIGGENSVSELGQMSFVATRYGTSSADGMVGVIGPTRMDYSRAIAAVHCVAEGLNEVLDDTPTSV